MKITVCNNNDLGTNSYVLEVKGRFVVIDPNNSKEIDRIIDGSPLDFIFVTHEHYDHIRGVDFLRKKYCCDVVMHEVASLNSQLSSKNMSRYAGVLYKYMNKKQNDPVTEFVISEANITFDSSLTIRWQGHSFNFTHTPGHTAGSACITTGNYLFSGDSLFECCEPMLIGKKSQQDYATVTLNYLESLPDDTLVKPGHERPFLLREKIYAHEIALKVFHSSDVKTNWNLDFEYFEIYLKKYLFLVRNGNLFLRVDEGDLSFLYYWISDQTRIDELHGFLAKERRLSVVGFCDAFEGFYDELPSWEVLLNTTGV